MRFRVKACAATKPTVADLLKAEAGKPQKPAASSSPEEDPGEEPAGDIVPSPA